MLMGVLSTSLAIIIGLYVSSISLNIMIQQQKVIEILIRTLLGLSAFVLIAIIMAIVAASWQAYPLLHHF